MKRKEEIEPKKTKNELGFRRWWEVPAKAGVCWWCRVELGANDGWESKIGGGREGSRCLGYGEKTERGRAWEGVKVSRWEWESKFKCFLPKFKVREQM